MEHPIHPVRTWMVAQGVDEVRLSVELRQLGLDYKPSYLHQVVDGYYPPARKLQNALHTITGVSINDIATYPYRAERAA